MSDAAITPERTEELLRALGEQLEARGARLELVVIGGAALGVLGLIERPTRDVDVVAIRTGNELVIAKPLPTVLEEAAQRVATDFGLPSTWLNAEPSEELVRLGLPEGFEHRLVSRTFSKSLTAHFADRYDQIHFKLYAMVDHGLGRHQQDLEDLRPSPDELIAAARWAITHDPSQGFREELARVLRYLGVPEDADLD
jgi:hypothetical protein